MKTVHFHRDLLLLSVKLFQFLIHSVLLKLELLQLFLKLLIIELVQLRSGTCRSYLHFHVVFKLISLLLQMCFLFANRRQDLVETVEAHWVLHRNS